MDQDKRISQYNTLDQRREYVRIHMWVYSKLGKASKCSFDSTHKSKRFEWANRSQQYKKDVNDWIELCCKCHKRYDGVSEKTRRKMSLSQKGKKNRARPIICVELNKEWPSAKDAGQNLGIVYKSINNCLRGRAKTSAGYHWKYKES